MKKDVKSSVMNTKKREKINQLVIKNQSKRNNRKNEYMKKSDHKIVKKKQKNPRNNTRSQNYEKALIG